MKQLELYKWEEYNIIIDDRVDYIRMPEKMALNLNAIPSKHPSNQLELDLKFPKNEKKE